MPEQTDYEYCALLAAFKRLTTPVCHQIVAAAFEARDETYDPAELSLLSTLIEAAAHASDNPDLIAEIAEIAA